MKDRVMGHIDLSIEELPTHLSIVADGTYGVQAMHVAIDRIVEVAQELGHSKVLVDLTRIRSGPRWIHERAGIGRHAAEAFAGLRVAVLYSADPQDRIAEVSAAERGTQMRVWSNKRAALNWLLRNPQT